MRWLSSGDNAANNSDTYNSIGIVNQQTIGGWEVNEIKATAPTREELYQEVKRLKESNAQLVERLELAESFMSDSEWVSYLANVENKTND
jgi:hypothetical protein